MKCLSRPGGSEMSDQGAGVFVGGITFVRNSICRGNSPDELDILTSTTYLDISSCEIEGGWTSAGSNNFNADPDFMSPINLRLSLGSPCIDTASNGCCADEDLEREFIINFTQRGVFQIAEDSQDQKIIGFQVLEPFATYTHAFDHVAMIATFVDLDYRRRGIGMCLSEVTFEIARGKGYEKIFTFVRADNPAALQFYLDLGFRIVGTAQKQAKIGDKYIDEIVIEKFL
ncbi:MAG: GNAT family N-acetyltransferase [Sedimentisphaerales bacterium]|nr:GNAT family N-acetyltransferase [Sedimentisphaerales bacterium]